MCIKLFTSVDLLHTKMLSISSVESGYLFSSRIGSRCSCQDTSRRFPTVVRPVLLCISASFKIEIKMRIFGIRTVIFALPGIFQFQILFTLKI